jgi:hypothetical protein
MSGWEPAGNGLEAKITGSGKLLLRDAGQTTEYPHFTVTYDSQGRMDWEQSDSRRGSRVGRDEVISAALNFLRGKGLL